MSGALRKGKKNWRKNVDVTGIQDKLESVQAEKRLGKTSFFEDRAGDSSLKKNRKLRISNLLVNNDNELVMRKTKVNSVPVNNGVKIRQISKIIKQKIDTIALRKKEKGLKPGSAVASKLSKIALKKKEAVRAKGGFDIWDKEEVVHDNNDYLVDVRKRAVVKQEQDYKQPKSIDAVIVSHPGTSYKPTKADHKEAIRVAANVEFDKIDKKEKLISELSYPKELDDIVEDDFFDGFSDEEEEELVVESDEQDEKRKEHKKTRSEVNRKKRFKLTLQNEISIQQQKSFAKQLNMIRELAKEVDREEEMMSKKRDLRNELMEVKRNSRTKKMSRHNFVPAPMEIQLVEEMGETLRNLKPEGNLVKDRFQSLQMRNLIETRVVVKRKSKYKKKEVESHDYKRFK